MFSAFVLNVGCLVWVWWDVFWVVGLRLVGGLVVIGCLR